MQFLPVFEALNFRFAAVAGSACFCAAEKGGIVVVRGSERLCGDDAALRCQEMQQRKVTPDETHAFPALLASGALAALPALAQDAAAPVPDKGDTTWMLVSAILVMMMTLPGLALFYGGLVRSKNVLSVLMQVLTTFCVMALLWVIYGYSLAFTGAGSAEDAGFLTPYIGNLSKAFLSGVTTSSIAETFSAGVYIPELSFVIFQMAFACIAPALIVGATAERMKFPAILAFVVLWFTFAYLPMAHMVWWWGGPSAYDAPSGMLFGHGALDFAGGTVIHINAGVAGLVAALVAGPRLGYRRELIAPHNLTFTLIGGCLLFIGWFGFNAGSNLEANGLDDLVPEGVEARAGGAELVQLGILDDSTAAAVQTQDPQADDGPYRGAVRSELVRAADLLRTERFPAVAGAHCRDCSFVPICPIKSAGSVTDQ